MPLLFSPAAFGGEKWKTNVLLTSFLCPMDGCGAPGDISPRYQGGSESHLGDKNTSIIISEVHI